LWNQDVAAGETLTIVVHEANGTSGTFQIDVGPGFELP
jgi:hypothetical protein